jgi:tRNA A22 N-methylase
MNATFFFFFLQKSKLDTTLNINNYRLRDERKKMYLLVVAEIKHNFSKDTKSNTTVSKAFLEKRIKDFSEKKNGKYEQHCQVAIYFLTKKLGKSQK